MKHFIRKAAAKVLHNPRNSKKAKIAAGLDITQRKK